MVLTLVGLSMLVFLMLRLVPGTVVEQNPTGNRPRGQTRARVPRSWCVSELQLK